MTAIHELGLPLQELSPAHQRIFHNLYDAKEKNRSTVILLAFLTPVLHHFYLGHYTAWLFYLALLVASIPVMMFWLVPMIWALEGLIFSGTYTKRANVVLASEIFMKLRAMQPAHQEPPVSNS